MYLFLLFLLVCAVGAFITRESFVDHVCNMLSCLFIGGVIIWLLWGKNPFLATEFQKSNREIKQFVHSAFTGKKDTRSPTHYKRRPRWDDLPPPECAGKG